MQAYLNDPKLKKDFIRELKKHKKADAFVQGTYSKDGSDEFRGCAVGCSIESLNRIKDKDYSYSKHSSYEVLIGVPEVLAYLEDRIFEGLPVEASKEWPLLFAQAIKPGADLEMVMPKFMVWLMGDLEQYATDEVKAFLRGVGRLYERRINGVEPSMSEWRAAANAAAYQKMADKLTELLGEAVLDPAQAAGKAGTV